MPSSEAQRTLVKSPPELWAELSDPVSLARHMSPFGEIRIARVEGETSVEWEADAIAGTVQLEPSGWGTKVTLTVVREMPEPEAVPEPEPEPEASSEPEAPRLAPEAEPAAEESAEAPPLTRRSKLLARLLRRRRARAAMLEQPPAVEAEPEQPEPTLEEVEPPNLAAELAAELARMEETMAEQDAALLTTVLDRLGAAHHRPFSRG
jgi:hypothetical protein